VSNVLWFSMRLYRRFEPASPTSGPGGVFFSLSSRQDSYRRRRHRPMLFSWTDI